MKTADPADHSAERTAGFRPRARSSNVVMTDLGGECLIYDLKAHRAHRLNKPAALVWNSCDGRTTVGELKTLLQTNLKAPCDDAAVWLALDQLAEAGLLQEWRTSAVARASVSRRKLLRQVGAGLAAGAVLVPVVESIVAPHAIQAQSAGCGQLHQACGVGCCTGLNCNSGTCCVGTGTRAPGVGCNNNNQCCSGNCPGTGSGRTCA